MTVFSWNVKIYPITMNDYQENSNKTVFVGLSGGVDSAVSACLLKEQGYKVVGVFMKNWSGDDYGLQAECPWENDQNDAEAVCKHIGIEFRSFNFEKEYRAKVVEYFFDEYSKGRTPNPDVMCNKEIKFKLFLEKAKDLGADLIATGHYAIKTTDSLGNPHMLKGVDNNKDQTYFLYNLTKDQLSRTLFPVGNLQKSEVRKLAEKYNLPNAKKPDSQGICFIGEINVLKFLMKRIPEKEGDIIDFDSKKVVGKHKGVYFHTIGQRGGLGIGGQEVPYYVVSKDIQENILYVGHGHNHSAMLKTEIELENLHIINNDIESSLLTDENLSASIRYRHKPEAGKLILKKDEYFFIFEKPQRAASSGQSLVIYRDEECIGGGVIK